MTERFSVLVPRALFGEKLTYDAKLEPDFVGSVKSDELVTWFFIPVDSFYRERAEVSLLQL